MRTVTIDDLIEDFPATRVDGGSAVVRLEYQGSAHVLTGSPPSPARIRSQRQFFTLPLIEPPAENDLLDLALQLVMAVVQSRPRKMSQARFVDIDVRDALRHADGRGSWTVSTRLLADPSVKIPRWVEAHPANLPAGWVVGIATLDNRRPILRVTHEGRVGFLACDPMIVGIWTD